MTQWKKQNLNKNKKHEGFTIKEGLTSSTDSTARGSAAPDSVAAEISDVGEAIDDKLDKKSSKSYSSPENIVSTMRGEFDQIADGIDNLTDGISGIYDGLDSGMGNTQLYGEMKGGIKSSFFDIKGSINTITNIIGEIAALISYFFQIVLSYLLLIKMTIELFLLNFNNYLKTVLTKMANALTQNTATESEITTFQDQTQKFLMLIMSWIFVYNWYYVCFYLKEQDNIRYTFDANQVMHFNSLLYCVLGPSFRALQKFNDIVMGFAKWIQTTKDDQGNTVPRFSGINHLIYIFMFFLFLTLVSANFQSVLIIDFFNALHLQFGPSLMTILTGGLVFMYSGKYLWYESGWFELLKWGGMIAPLGWICFLLTILWYIAVTVGLQLPFAIMLIFTYLFVYSFFGVLLYQGTNVFNTFLGISSEVASIEPNIEKDDVCMNPPEFEFSLTYIWNNYIKYYGEGMLNWGTVYIFEIMIIFLLLGGIGVYSTNFTSSVAGKFSASSYSGNSLKNSLTYLFTWLILINVLLIALIITFMVQKYQYIQSETPTTNPTGPQMDVSIPDSTGAFQGSEFLSNPMVSISPNIPLVVKEPPVTLAPLVTQQPTVIQDPLVAKRPPAAGAGP